MEQKKNTMRIDFTRTFLPNTFALGIETSWPRCIGCWVYCSVVVNIGPYHLYIAIGSEKIYNETVGKHSTKEEV